MSKYLITSDAGPILGVYEGATKEQALAALIEDAGDSGEANPRMEDVHIKEVSITADDENGICEWLNVASAEVNAEGDIWVEKAGGNRWLDDDEKKDYICWRAER
jgi:hypothetical protein